MRSCVRARVSVHACVLACVRVCVHASIGVRALDEGLEGCACVRYVCVCV
jgi:hypothetical protein